MRIRLKQDHKQKGGSYRPSAASRFFNNRNAVIISAVGLLAAVAVICTVVVLWPKEEKLPADASSGSWSEPAEDKTYDAALGHIDKKAYSGTVLEETPDAGREYLDDTLFIGDSNTYRYMMYADSKGVPFTGVDNTIGVVSMGAGAITSKPCMQFYGYNDLVTIPKAVKIMQPQRIIIGFGSNNLTAKTETFIEEYKQGLKAIHEAYPYADIIVNAVPPLDKQRENTSLTMKQVDAFNKAIARMCSEEGYKFLDSSEALKDPDTGWAKKNYTLGDGVHLNKDGVTALFEYIRTHAYIAEDIRPKPLKPVPKVQGVPPGLISQDPIAVRGAKVPVNFVVSGNGWIEGQTSQMVKKGLACSAVTAVADEGWYFDHWEASIGHVENADTIVFTVPPEVDANGVVITAVFGQEVHEHYWEEIERQEPLCVFEGYIKYQCSCGEQRTEVLPATGKHIYGDTTGTCFNCGQINPEWVPPTPTPTPTPMPTPSPAPPEAPVTPAPPVDPATPAPAPDGSTPPAQG